MGLERKKREQELRKKAEAEIREAFGWELNGVRHDTPKLRAWLLEYLQLDESDRRKKYEDLLPTLNRKGANGIAWVLDCAKADWYAELLIDMLTDAEE